MDPAVIIMILDPFGLRTSLPPVLPVRAPPGSESLFDV